MNIQGIFIFLAGFVAWFLFVLALILISFNKLGEDLRKETMDELNKRFNSSSCSSDAE